MISNPINKSIWAHDRTVKVLAWEVWPHGQRYKYKYNIFDISDCVIILSLFYVYWLKMYGCYIDCFCDLTYPISMYWSMGWIKMKWNEMKQNNKTMPLCNKQPKMLVINWTAFNNYGSKRIWRRHDTEYFTL
jgi:hypothetical protein